jgi:excinuclease ABC subunit A
MRAELEQYMSEHPCPDCQGKRLKKDSLAVTVGGINIAEFSDKSILEALDFVNSLKLTGKDAMIADVILKEIRERLAS